MKKNKKIYWKKRKVSIECRGKKKIKKEKTNEGKKAWKYWNSKKRERERAIF